MLPESSHLPAAPQRERSQELAASSPLKGSFLARLRQQRALCGCEGPGGRALAMSPLGPCQPGRAVPLPPTRPGTGWAGPGARNSRKRDLGSRREERNAPGRAVLATGSSGPLPARAEPDFTPWFIPVPRQGRKMRLQGRGHSGLEVDFHLEVPSALLTLGGYHKATGNPQGRRGGFFRKFVFHP